MAWNGTYRVRPRKGGKAKKKTKKARRLRRVRFSKKSLRAAAAAVGKQRGGKGSAALLDGYLGYPVTGKIPSIEIGDVDSVPMVMSKDDYEELAAEL